MDQIFHQKNTQHFQHDSMCTPTFLHNTEFAHSLLEILQSDQIHKQELFPDRSLSW